MMKQKNQPNQTSCESVGRGLVSVMPTRMVAGMKPYCRTVFFVCGVFVALCCVVDDVSGERRRSPSAARRRWAVQRTCAVARLQGPLRPSNTRLLNASSSVACSVHAQQSARSQAQSRCLSFLPLAAPHSQHTRSAHTRALHPSSPVRTWTAAPASSPAR